MRSARAKGWIGDDWLYGGADNDLLYGSDNDDTLDGESGDESGRRRRGRHPRLPALSDPFEAGGKLGRVGVEG